MNGYDGDAISEAELYGMEEQDFDSIQDTGRNSFVTWVKGLAERVEVRPPTKALLGIGINRNTSYACEFCSKRKTYPGGMKSHRGFRWCGECEPYDKTPSVTRIEKEVFGERHG